jgi:small subunit ribosomal protein S21
LINSSKSCIFTFYKNFKKGVHLIKVVVQDNESIDKALKRFKKKYEKAGVLKEFRRRQFFVKPSVDKKMNKERAIRKSKRIIAEENN